MKSIIPSSATSAPGLLVSFLPVAMLLTFLAGIIIFAGADAISEYSPYSLLCAALTAVALSLAGKTLSKRGLIIGIRRSAKQILPAVPMLVCIAMVATTWMLSGVVPVLISFGLNVLSPTFFLAISCAVCGVISILTGSSWSTIATIGVAFMGIGTVMGIPAGWVAGAIISGAYFGDKVSPLSDTTVIASSSCGVDLFTHIRYLMITTVPSIAIALLVFTIAGFNIDISGEIENTEILSLLGANFNLTPWVLVIPAVTLTLIALRVHTLLTLFISSMLGLAGIFIFQPGIVDHLGITGLSSGISATLALLWNETTFSTGHELFDSLVTTSGILGMMSTIALVLSAMLFGSAMIGTGMLSTITHTITRHIRRRFPLVTATAASGLFLNSCTADQYLSIIIGGNMFRNAYRRCGLESRLLSRTLEDSVSVTSVLIPWNSCGVTQSSVLGVSTLVYFPFCVFNYLSPLITVAISLFGFKIRQTMTAPTLAKV